MNSLRRHLSLICMVSAVAFTVFADDEDLPDDFIRENPEIEFNGGSSCQDSCAAVGLSAYRFLDAAENVISLNGADWSGLASAMVNSGEKAVRIVHIGDSHIQADISTGHVRRLFQNRFGSAGRGLIVPLKLAGTNQPIDFSIKSTSKFSSEKLIANNWSRPMGFTGISLTPDSQAFGFTVAASEPFERLFIYYGGGTPSVTSVRSGSSSLIYAESYDDVPGALEIGLPFPCEEITVDLTSFGNVSIYGMELVSDEVGVAYNSIGINGAMYSSYNRVPEFGRSIAMLEPDLIIVSLGTNEAFGRFNREEFLRQVDSLVSDLQANSPDACILLVTPSECQRRIRRKGRVSYVVNNRIADVRSAIVDYGAANGVAVYDWYRAAGGAGSSNAWISAKLFSRDRIHHSRQGYEVAGQMLYNAIINALSLKEFD